MSPDRVSLLASQIPVGGIVAFAGLVGLFIGSFLNVVAYRTPLGLSVSKPRSFCPRCKRQLTWWENMPVVSWVALRGRCHGCGDPISLRYPAVELATGGSFAYVTWAWNGSGVAAGYCVLAAAMIVVALVEYGGRRSPLGIAATGTALGQLLIVVAALWGHHWRILTGSLTGSAVAVLVFSLLRVTDPDCVDPRGFGRSALLMAGCWAGGLSLPALGIGAAVWIIVYFLCMLMTWTTTRSVAVGDGSNPTVVSPSRPVFGVPLVTSLAAAMAVALLAIA
jgi:leader peptidase (prepilin peptidase) / N-methyltransferase